LNYTVLPHIWNVYPSFFQSPMGPLHGSRVKIRGYIIAHKTSLSPRTTTEFGERAFSFAGPHVWNQLTHRLRAISNPAAFKKHLKTRVLNSVFN